MPRDMSEGHVDRCWDCGSDKRGRYEDDGLCGQCFRRMKREKKDALIFGYEETIGEITAMHNIHDLLTGDKWTSLTFKTSDINNLPGQGETCVILNGLQTLKGFKRISARMSLNELPYFAEIHFKREKKEDA